MDKPPKVEISSPQMAQYIPWAKHQLSLLTTARTRQGSQQLRKTYALADATIEIISSERQDRIRIIGGKQVSGFFCLPRTGALTNRGFAITTKVPSSEAHIIVDGSGFFPDGTASTDSSFAYPLTDGSKAVENLTKNDKGDWKFQKTPPYLYGNIDWKGPNTSLDADKSNAPVLTWKGPPSRHFALSQYLEIPGFTSLDYYIAAVDGDYAQHTPFSKYVYREGQIVARAPDVNYPQSDIEVDHGGQVLGAAYTTRTYEDGTTERWMVIVVKAVYHTIAGHADGTFYAVYGAPAGGTMDPAGWFLMGEYGIAFKPRAAFFFDQTGTEAQAVDNNTVWTVTINAQMQATITGEDAGSGSALVNAFSRTDTSDAAKALRDQMPVMVSAHAQGGTDYYHAWWLGWEYGSANYNKYILPLKNVKGRDINTHNTVSITKTGETIIGKDYDSTGAEVTAKVIISSTEDTTYTRDDNNAAYYDGTYGGIWGDVKWVINSPQAHPPWIGIDNSGSLSEGEQIIISTKNDCNGTITLTTTCGSIDANRVITGLTSCCSGPNNLAIFTVTATLTTNEGTATASKTFRGPNGSWVLVNVVDVGAPVSACDTAGYVEGCYPFPIWDYPSPWTMVRNWAYSYYRVLGAPCFSPCGGPQAGVPGKGEQVCYTWNFADCFFGACSVVYKEDTYEWRC